MASVADPAADREAKIATAAAERDGHAQRDVEGHVGEPEHGHQQRHRARADRQHPERLVPAQAGWEEQPHEPEPRQPEQEHGGHARLQGLPDGVGADDARAQRQVERVGRGDVGDREDAERAQRPAPLRPVRRRRR